LARPARLRGAPHRDRADYHRPALYLGARGQPAAAAGELFRPALGMDGAWRGSDAGDGSRRRHRDLDADPPYCPDAPSGPAHGRRSVRDRGERLNDLFAVEDVGSDLPELAEPLAPAR